jgi:hypothetical protein
MCCDIGNCAMIPVDCTVHCMPCDTSANTPRFSYPYGTMNFMPALGIRILIANSCTRSRWIFTGLSQDGERADFIKTSAPSLDSWDQEYGASNY